MTDKSSLHEGGVAAGFNQCASMCMIVPECGEGDCRKRRENIKHADTDERKGKMRSDSNGFDERQGC